MLLLKMCLELFTVDAELIAKGPTKELMANVSTIKVLAILNA